MKHTITSFALVFAFGLILFVSILGNGTADASTFVVRDAATAVQLAEVVIRQEFGKQELAKLLPLSASKIGERWVVRGIRDKRIPKQTRGGIAVVEIAMNGGCILAVRYEI